MHKITRETRSSRPRECPGGILADEMGMGKSLAVLALIVHTLEQIRSALQETKNLSPHVGTGEPSSRATLIITPKSSTGPAVQLQLSADMNLALYSWESEIKRFGRYDMSLRSG